MNGCRLTRFLCDRRQVLRHPTRTALGELGCAYCVGILELETSVRAEPVEALRGASTLRPFNKLRTGKLNVNGSSGSHHLNSTYLCALLACVGLADWIAFATLLIRPREV